MIYCIGNREKGVCKIGYTSRAIEKRLAALQTGNPYPLTVFGLKDGQEIHEQLLHVKFKAHRLNGEWFHLCQDIASEFEFEVNMPNKLWAASLTFLTSSGFIQKEFREDRAVLAPTEHEALLAAKQLCEGSGVLIRSVLIEVPNDRVAAAYLDILGTPS